MHQSSRMEASSEWTPSEKEEEKKLFGVMSAGQARYVREWISGKHHSRSECYAAAMKRDPKASKKALASLAQRMHTNEKVQAGIAFLTHKANTEALLSMEEKRRVLAGIVRAHSPRDRKVNPENPLREYPLLDAIRLDNVMSGETREEGGAQISIGVILQNLKSAPLVQAEKVQEELPIPNASGGFGRIPGRLQAGELLEREEEPGEERSSSRPGPFA